MRCRQEGKAAQAVPRPAVVSKKGKPQHDATPKAAASPAAVNTTAPAPRVGRSSGATSGSVMTISWLPCPTTLLSVATTDASPFLKVIGMQQGGIPIGDVSRRTGCKVETIRYYERIGLLPLPDRRGRYRRYRACDINS